MLDNKQVNMTIHNVLRIRFNYKSMKREYIGIKELKMKTK